MGRASSIRDLLSSSLNRAGISRGVEAARIVDAANDYLKITFGPEIVKEARAVSAVRSELRVAVESSVVASEIKMHADALLRHIRELTGTSTIERLVVVPLTEQPLS